MQRYRFGALKSRRPVTGAVLWVLALAAWGGDARVVAIGAGAEQGTVPQKTATALRDYSLVELRKHCEEPLTLIGDVSRHEPDRPFQYWLRPIDGSASRGSEAILVDGGLAERPPLKVRLAVTGMVECRRVYYKTPPGTPLRHSDETVFRETSRAVAK
jgi:hypothetical protein